MTSQLENRQSSQIQKIVRDGSVVYEKQYVTNDWDDDAELVRHRASLEVGLLEQLAECDRFGRRLGVVRIATADPDSATIATFEVEGITLDQFILRSGKTASLLPWFLAGRWLREFHALRPFGGPLEAISKRDPTDIVDYCDLRIRSLSEYGYSWPKLPVREALLETIEDLRNRCKTQDVSPVWVHADFSPGNLLWDGRVVTPIDFAMVRQGGRLDDATYLIHRIEMHRTYRPWLNIPATGIRQAILRGLGVQNAEQSAAYKLLMIKHQICRLHTYVRRPAISLKQSLHDRWVRSALRRQLYSAIKNEKQVESSK